MYYWGGVWNSQRQTGISSCLGIPARRICLSTTATSATAKLLLRAKEQALHRNPWHPWTGQPVGWISTGSPIRLSKRSSKVFRMSHRWHLSGTNSTSDSMSAVYLGLVLCVDEMRNRNTSSFPPATRNIASISLPLYCGFTRRHLNSEANFWTRVLALSSASPSSSTNLTDLPRIMCLAIGSNLVMNSIRIVRQKKTSFNLLSAKLYGKPWTEFVQHSRNNKKSAILRS